MRLKFQYEFITDTFLIKWSQFDKTGSVSFDFAGKPKT